MPRPRSRATPTSPRRTSSPSPTDPTPPAASRQSFRTASIDALGTDSQRIYKDVANRTAKNGYRPDLRADAVARVSAIRNSQRPKKDTPPKKLRGAAARKAAEKAEEGA